jgi:anthranilate phosphoribosyltransferase
VDKPPPAWFQQTLAQLLERRDLSPSQMRTMFSDLISRQCSEVEAASLLVALRAKGETASELAEAARVLRKHMVPLETGRKGLLDTCGTGGDQTGTFNISTAAALVVAAAGVPVVKHGNRAVSSQSGSADVLRALGVVLQEDREWPRRCLEAAGIAFCFAPHFHPALAHLAPLRRQLKVRTILNCLGPLANPAGAAFQLLGVGRPELLDPMAGALAQLGIEHAFVVHGQDGLDEVTLTAPTRVREIRHEKISSWEWEPGDFGLAACTLAELRFAGPQESATVIMRAFQGQKSPAADVVVANAAAALLAADRVASLREGVDVAWELLRTGRARQVLERWRICSAIAGNAGPLTAEVRQ